MTELFVSSTADVAFFEVKLCDVAPDGSSKLITYGGLNATHRDSHSHPKALVPNQVYPLKINLDSMAYVFPAGHRIRVDVSSADFQNAWPVSRRAVNFRPSQPDAYALPGYPSSSYVRNKVLSCRSQT